MKRNLVLGNWKMHGGVVSNNLLFSVLAAYAGVGCVDVGVCVPAAYLPQVRQAFAQGPLAWGAQHISVHLEGAYTSDISARMIAEFGTTYVLVGHSECRLHHGKRGQTVAVKARHALDAGLVPVICVGESESERDAGSAEQWARDQLLEVIESLPAEFVKCAVITYEPVWAIGVGRSATAEQAQAMHATLRSCRRHFVEGGESVRLL